MEKVIGLLKSRKFWAAAIALIFMIAMAIDPAFPLEEEQVLGIVALAATYIIGTAIEGGWKEFGDVKSKLFGLLQSRKFWATLVGFALTLMNSLFPDFPLEAEHILPLIVTVMSYVLGTAIEDKAKNGYLTITTTIDDRAELE
jgi:hypothetical protein